MVHREQTVKQTAAVDAGPLGLKNYGNTCFINAVVQSLAYCDSFVQVAGDSSYPCSHVNCAVCALKSTVLALRKVPPHLDMIDLNLQRLIRCLSLYPLKSLTIGRQEDVHEFLHSMVLGFAQSHKGQTDAETQANHQRHHPIAQLFNGSLCGSIYCYECKQTSTRTEPMAGLEVPVEPTKTLLQGIEDFCRIEDLQGANAYACERCGRNTHAQKSLTIERLPRILPIQMKRFACTANECHKVASFMEYPTRLDLRPFLTPQTQIDLVGDDDGSGDASPTEYRLRAFVVHAGASPESGHYLTYVRHRATRCWYALDDQQVRPLSQHEALRQTPYLLFYEQATAADVAADAPRATRAAASVANAAGPGPASPLPFFAHPLQDATTQYATRSSSMTQASPLPNSLRSATAAASLFASPDAAQASEPLWWEQNPSRKTDATAATAAAATRNTRKRGLHSDADAEGGTEMLPLPHRTPPRGALSDEVDDGPARKRRVGDTAAAPFASPSATATAVAFHVGALHPSPLKQPRNSVVIHEAAKKHRRREEAAATATGRLADLDELHASHRKAPRPATSTRRASTLRRLLPSWLTSSYFFFTKRQQRERAEDAAADERRRRRQPTATAADDDSDGDRDGDGGGDARATRKRKWDGDPDDDDAQRAIDYERIYHTPRGDARAATAAAAGDGDDGVNDDDEVDEMTTATMALADLDDVGLPPAVQAQLARQRSSPAKRSRHEPVAQSGGGWFGIVGRIGRSLFGGGGGSAAVPAAAASTAATAPVDVTAPPAAAPVVDLTQPAQPTQRSPDVFVTDVDDDDDNDGAAGRFSGGRYGSGSPRSDRAASFASLTSLSAGGPHDAQSPWLADLLGSLFAGATMSPPTRRRLRRTPPRDADAANGDGANGDGASGDEDDADGDDWTQWSTVSSSSPARRPPTNGNAPNDTAAATAPASSTFASPSALDRYPAADLAGQQLLRWQPRPPTFFELLVQPLFDVDSVAHRLATLPTSHFVAGLRSSAATSRASSRGTSRRVSFSGHDEAAAMGAGPASWRSPPRHFHANPLRFRNGGGLPPLSSSFAVAMATGHSKWE